MRIYDTVLFDLDGTLLDTLDDLTDSANHILETNGYPIRTRAEIRSFLGNGSRRLIARALPYGEETPRFEELFSDYKAWYNSHCEMKTMPYPGVENVLRELRAAGCAAAIVTNKHAAAAAPLRERFFPGVTVIGQRDGLRQKPSPDMVEEALSQLGKTRKGAVYVGDSEVDFQTARNAGLPCILVTWGFRDREQLAKLEPEHLADTPQELLKLLVR